MGKKIRKASPPNCFIGDKDRSYWSNKMMEEKGDAGRQEQKPLASSGGNQSPQWKIKGFPFRSAGPRII